MYVRDRGGRVQGAFFAGSLRGPARGRGLTPCLGRGPDLARFIKRMIAVLLGLVAIVAMETLLSTSAVGFIL